MRRRTRLEWVRLLASSILGLVFLAAAAGKALGLADFRLFLTEVGRGLETPWLGAHVDEASLALIGIEALLGLLLLAGIGRRAAPVAALAFLAVVTGVQAWLWRSGAWTRCGCGVPWLDFADYRAIVLRNAVLAALAWISYVLARANR